MDICDNDIGAMNRGEADDCDRDIRGTNIGIGVTNIGVTYHNVTGTKIGATDIDATDIDATDFRHRIGCHAHGCHQYDDYGFGTSYVCPLYCTNFQSNLMNHNPE